MRDADFARLMPALVQHLRAEALASADTDDTDDDEGDGDAPPPGDFVPASVLREHGLVPWLDALAAMHAGLGGNADATARRAARRRLVFNEALLLSLMMLNHRQRLQTADGGSALSSPVICSGKVREAIQKPVCHGACLPSRNFTAQRCCLPPCCHSPVRSCDLLCLVHRLCACTSSVMVL
jgi:hypothetical protein